MRNHINAVATTASPAPPPATGVSDDRPTGTVVRLPETGFLRQPQVLVFVPISRPRYGAAFRQAPFPDRSSCPPASPHGAPRTFAAGSSIRAPMVER